MQDIERRFRAIGRIGRITAKERVPQQLLAKLSFQETMLNLVSEPSQPPITRGIAVRRTMPKNFESFFEEALSLCRQLGRKARAACERVVNEYLRFLPNSPSIR